MEKLSERIHTLVPRKSDKLKADLVDFVIYLVTMVPIINIYTPLYGKEDYNWYKAVIFGSLIFILLNYFIRYYIPMRFKGKSIGKLLFNIKTVDYYGYAVKPNQLLMRESIYIFFPLLSFSKFTDINYILIGVWALIFVVSVINSYFLSSLSNRVTRTETLKYLRKSGAELTEEVYEETGLNIFDKTTTLYKHHKNEKDQLKSVYKSELKELLSSQKEDLNNIPKEDKDTRYDLSLKQKQDKEKLRNNYIAELNRITDIYNEELFEVEKVEFAKLEETSLGFRKQNPDYDDKRTNGFTGFIQKRNKQTQNRSLMDKLANTVVVDAYKFDKFYEEYRSEE